MNERQLEFMLNRLKKFCVDRSIYIIKDLQKIPTISNRTAFVRRTQLEFDNQVENLLQEFPFEVNIYLDNVTNLERFIPSLCIVIVGELSFLVYDIFADRFYKYCNGHLFIGDLQVCPAENKYVPLSLLSPSAQICYYLAGFSEKPDIDENHYLRQFLDKLHYKW